MIQPTVSAAFSRSRETIGYPSPSFVTTELGFTPEHPLHGPVRRHMYEHPTRSFLYWGATRVVKRILKKGDPVVVWTDEYKQRLESSGLPGLQQYGDMSFITGGNKQEQIPDIFSLARERQVKEMVVVDDRRENLQEIYAYAQSQDIPVRLVLVQKRGRQAYEAPYVVVTTVRKAEHAARRNRTGEKGKTLWVFDFNRTLLDTDAFERSVMVGVGKIIRNERSTLVWNPDS